MSNKKPLTVEEFNAWAESPEGIERHKEFSRAIVDGLNKGVKES